MAPSLRDSGICGWASNPTLKRGANQHCAYGALAKVAKDERTGYEHETKDGLFDDLRALCP
jgi:hypothetical protein